MIVLILLAVLGALTVVGKVKDAAGNLVDRVRDEDDDRTAAGEPRPAP